MSLVSNTNGKHLSESDILDLYRNISSTLNLLRLQQSTSESEEEEKKKKIYYNDSANAWLYILFVLTFYAFSIVVLMIKYIKSERESAKLEYYYNEFVKRDWYKDKNLYDPRGRRIHFRVDGTTVTRVKRRASYLADPEADFFDESDQSCNDADCESCGSDESCCCVQEGQNRLDVKKPRKSVMLCVGAASILAESAAVSLVPIKANGSIETRRPQPLGARPKKTSLRNWPPDKKAVHENHFSKECNGFGPDKEESQEPLAFLHSGNKLMLTKVDESELLRRTKSPPPKAGRAAAAARAAGQAAGSMGGIRAAVRAAEKEVPS